MQEQIKCKRCGKCCYYEKDEKLYRCKYLKNTEDDKTFCKIYHRSGRLGLQIDKGIYCLLRTQQGGIIEECPYNAIIMAKRIK